MSYPRKRVMLTSPLKRILESGDGKLGNPALLAINGTIYDVSDFASSHPGGRHILSLYFGGDATNEFYEVGHSDEAIAMLTEFIYLKLD